MMVPTFSPIRIFASAPGDDMSKTTIGKLLSPSGQWYEGRGVTPDLIVSAIGTNDFTPGIPARDAYVNEYVALVQALLRDHPQARVVLTEGAILDGEKKAALRGYIDETIRRAAGRKAGHG